MEIAGWKPIQTDGRSFVVSEHFVGIDRAVDTDPFDNGRVSIRRIHGQVTGSKASTYAGKPGGVASLHDRLARSRYLRH